jgi:hypothetical protein
MSTSTSVVRVHRLHSAYLIASSEADAARIRARLDDVVTQGLRQALATIAAPLAANSDPSVWLIRKLEVPVVVNAAWQPEQIARIWATDICRELARDLSAADDGSNVLHFPNRAAYLARFMTDLAAGRAWGQWYYRAFGGLSALPTSAALRTAICESAAEGLAALHGLGGQELLHVIGALSAHDAVRVLDSVAAVDALDELATCFRSAWATWGAMRDLLAPLDAAQAALALCVRTSMPGQQATLNLHTASKAIVRLARALERQAPLTHHSMDGLRDFAAGDAELLSVLSQCPPDVLAEMLAAPDSATPMSFSTPCGGAFMLMTALDTLPLGIAESWPPLSGTAAPQVLRMLLLAKCQGSARMAGAFGDPLLRDLLGIAPQIGWPELRAWLKQLGGGRLNELACALRGVSDDCDMSDVCAPHRRRRVRVRVDVDGLWRAAAGVPMAVGGAAIDAGAAQDIGADLDYLASPARLRLPPAWELLFSVAAQQVLRRFALRLNGFSQSRLDYLHRNFLDIVARIETDAERNVVCMARPPLQLILNLAGANRQQYRLQWLGPQAFILCSGD